jgi:hypothetical protein
MVPVAVDAGISIPERTADLHRTVAMRATEDVGTSHLLQRIRAFLRARQFV